MKMISPKHNRLFGVDPWFAMFVKRKIPVIKEACNLWSRGQFSNIPQGYTYLGQFFIHDIVGREKGKKRTSWKFDLDSIYADEHCLDQSGRFIFCQARGKYLPDIWRKLDDKKPIISEIRNDDQLLVAQLHLLFQLAHNCAVAELEKLKSEASSIDRFKAAKIFVTNSIKNILIKEFLQRICYRKVYEELITKKMDVIEIPSNNKKLPYELSHAVLRFGHSMVRQSYALNANKLDVSLIELFDFSFENGREMKDGIPKGYQINWNFFFPVSGHGQPDGSMKIDPFIVQEMASEKGANIVEKNIRAGAGKWLQSGQKIANILRERGLGCLGIHPSLKTSNANSKAKKLLEQHGLWRKTPLWLYILIEADMSQTYGETLGPVGSILLCETIKNATNFHAKVNNTNCGLLAAKDSMGELLTFIENCKNRRNLYGV